MTRAGMLRAAAARLKAAGIEEPMREARMLLAEAGGLDRATLTLRLEEPPAPAEAARFEVWLSAREARKPMAQILGRREFYGRVFRVTPDTLDPRPDSEALIEAALDALRRRSLSSPRILDLGLGTGCLILTLLAELPEARGLGVEASPAALAVARSNAAALGLEGRADLRSGDWLAGIEGPFDLVVSNPPYIREEERPDLAPEVADHEPALALFGGADGLEAYRRILADLAQILAPGGVAAFEHGHEQRAALTALAGAHGFALEEARDDAAGRPRVLVFRRRAEESPERTEKASF
ncbi:peptide chain release factor N(5)-glutamine methyltransferase [Neomegalonema sp.]|uniref:peptide chain release factor N(5)-glutamine methyltransferase n=1 Tax=Neomegalonema sp. TaxID=2039713 RepID=UPI00263059D9|nr:peptide chain release factor N(5)-glutamine methyltransferase [Neomegalonema sp.]MDD2867645.1 peptide chain release factor N(5)-glutamine methyltransferase [Neomegalonema sp.]